MKKRLRGLLALVLAFVTFFAGMPVETQAAATSIPTLYAHNNGGIVVENSDNLLSNFETHTNVAIGTEIQTLSTYSGWSEDQRDNIGGWKLWEVSSKTGDTIKVKSGCYKMFGQNKTISDAAYDYIENSPMAAVGAVMLEEPAIMGNITGSMGSDEALSTDWYLSPVGVCAKYSGGYYFVSTVAPEYADNAFNNSGLVPYVGFTSSVSNQTLYIIDGDGFYITRNISLNIDYTKPTIETVAVSDGESGEGIDTNMNPGITSLTVTAADTESGVAKYYVYCGTEDWSTKTPEAVKSGGTEHIWPSTNGVKDASASVSLTSLDYNTTYHYAVVAEDVAGNLSAVASGTFTTEKEPLTGTVTITGAYGEAEPYVFWDVLKANANITAPATPGDITYTWYRGSEEVQSGTTSTYQIGSADVGKEMWCKVTAANAKGSLESGKYAIGKAAFSGAYKVENVEVNDTYGIDKLTFTGEESAAPYEYRMRENDAAEWGNWNTITGGTVDSGQIDCSIVVGNVNRGIGDIQIRPKENANFVPTEDSLYTNVVPFTAELHESVALSGEAVYGGTLTANVTLGSFPDGNPTLLYTFKRGAEVVQAASTTNTYLVTKEDIGSQITVEVTTAEATGTLTATSAEVQKKGLTITGATVTEREYDGTTDANVESVTLSGMVTLDTLTMGTDFTVVSATYDSENAGTNNKNVEIKIALQGSAADYYTLSSDTYTLTNQTIRKKSVTLENARLEVLNGLAKTYEYALQRLLPTGVDYEEGSIALGTIDLPSDYYNGGAYLNSEYGKLSVPILNAASRSGEIGSISVSFESSNYKATANGVITVVAVQEKITGVENTPGNITLTDHKTSAEDVIQGTGILPDSVTVFTERTYPSGTQMPIIWGCGNYNTAPLAENTFTWTVDPNAYAAFATNGYAMTGSITVKNPAALAVAHGNTTDEITYNGATYDVSTLFSLDGNAGTASYSITGGTGAGSLNGSVLTITKAGTFVIQVDTAATGIYAAGSATAELTVNRGNGEATVTMTDFIYGGNASEPVTTSTTNTGVTATISYKEAGAADSTYTTTKPVNAGSYVVKSEYAATDLYNAVSVIDDFVINKAEITDVTSTLAGVIAPVAGEAPQNTLSVAAGEGYSAAISWDNNSSVYEYDTEYTATIVLATDENHKFADTVAIGSFIKSSGNESALTVKKSYETLKEKLTGVGTIADQTLNTHYTDAAAVIAANVLPATVKVQTETNTTGIDMAVEWSFTGSYDTAPEAENTFVWTVKATEYAAYDVNGQNLSGTIIVTNAGAVAVNHVGKTDTINYAGTTYDVSALFNLDTNAGTASYRITGGTGEGTLSGSILTITKSGTFEIQADTVATGIYAAGNAVGTLTVNKGIGAVTVTMDDFTFGVTNVEPVAGTTTNIGKDVVITYKVAGADDSTYTTTKPVNAGDYVVKATYAMTDLYNLAYATDTFTIEKAVIDDVSATLAGVTAPVAGEVPQNALSVAAGAGYSAAISWAPAVTAYDYDTEYTTTVVLTADANHKFGDTVAMGSFNKVSGSESALTAGKSYETAKEKITAVEDLQNQVITVHYADAADVLAANVLPTTVKVQTETNIAGIAMEVEWSFTGNYNTAPMAENTFTWTVKASEYAAYDVNGHAMNGTIVVTNAPAVAVNNQGKVATITYTGSTYNVNNTDLFELDSKAGTASYSIVGGTGAGTLNGSVLTITKAGTFVIKVDTAATGIYAAGSAQATLTVNRGVGAVTVEMADFTYGEAASEPVASTSTNTGVTAVISYKAEGAADSTYSVVKPTEVGSYVVKAEYAANDLYEAASATDTFVIEKAVIDDVSVTLAGVTAPVAGETPQNTLSVTAGAGYSAAISWAPTVTAYEYDTEYVVTVVLTADANHKFADTVAMGGFAKVSGSEGALTVSRSYETLKEKLTGVETIADQALTVHYADVAAVLAANVLPATVKVQTETNAGGVDMEVVWSFNNASGYNTAPEAENTFTWTVKASEYAAYDVNGQNLSGTITVTNAEALAVTNTGADDTITYTDETYEVSDMFTVDSKAGTASYSIVGGTGAGTLNGSVLTITKAGTLVIKVDTAEADIYAAGSAQATLTVNRGVGAATVEMADFTYGEAASEPVASTSTNIGVTAVISYKAEGAADSIYSVVKPTEVGSYVVKAEYAANDLYEAVSATDTFTIERAPQKDEGRKPFIKGEPHNAGWDVINAVIPYIKEGGTLVVDMNGTTIVPGYIQEHIRERKITLTIEMFPGLSWTIDGSKVEDGTRKTVDMGVRVGTMENPLNIIPSEILTKLVGNKKYVDVSLAHNGAFGFEAIMNIGLNAENAGMYGNLFYYNEQYGVMQFIWADDLDQYGTAHLVLSHASEYAIVLDKAIMQNSIASPKTGEENNGLANSWLLLTILCMTAGSYLTVKRRKRA